MKVALAYVHPQVTPKIYEPMARRFVEKYMEHPSGEHDHELYVLCTGGNESISSRVKSLFDPLVPQFIHHNNVGKDIGAYQMASQVIHCDLMVCLGAPARPHQDGWLDCMVRAVEDNGPGLYGCWGFHVPAIHIRTTVFWIPPQVLSAYPVVVDNKKRYEFEFGNNSITRFCMKKGLPILQVTNRGVFGPENWHHCEPEENLIADQHVDKHWK